MKKRIMDKRIKEKFMMDDAYLNGQARVCGWQATLAYNSLCRHVNTDQVSFPSITLMAEELDVSRDTVMKGIENLAKYHVIEIKRSRTKKGKWLNNSYILIDKSDWVKAKIDDTQVGVTDTDKGLPKSATATYPCRCQPLTHVGVADCKETHSKETHRKETHRTPPIKKTINSAFMTEEDFTRFWDIYPRKDAKANAKKIFLKIDQSKLPTILSAVEKQVRCDQWRENGGKFIPMPTTWLNQERWEDKGSKVELTLRERMIAEIKKYNGDPEMAMWSFTNEELMQHSDLFWQ